jgi:HEAT repeat protein
MDRSAALVAASSDRWEERAAAAGALASFDDTEADAALVALLSDENLAVIKRAAACLLTLPISGALERFTNAYAMADDQVGDAMNDELRVASATNPGLFSALMELANEGDAGAQLAVSWLG